MSSSGTTYTREEQVPPAAGVGRQPVRPRQGRVVLGRAGNALLPLLVLVVVLIIWQGFVVWHNVPSFVFPRLDKTWASLQTNWPDIWVNLQITLGEAGLGFVIGNALAIVGATIFVYSPLTERAFFPLAVIVQTIPIIVWSPILVLIFPSGSTWPQVAVAILISFFPSLVNMTRGLREVDPLELELFHVLNASRWQVYRKLRWPSSLPALFASLRITSTLSLVGAIVGEYVAGGGQGVGYELLTAKQNIDAALVVAITLVVTVTGVVVFLAVAGAERLFLSRRA